MKSFWPLFAHEKHVIEMAKPEIFQRTLVHFEISRSLFRRVYEPENRFPPLLKTL